MGGHPDVSELNSAHRALRRDVARLVADLSRRADPSRQRDQLASFAAMLELHHRAEDEVLWPALRAESPELGVELDALEREHRGLLGLVARLDRALAGEPSPVAADALAATLAAQLLGHLAREDERVLPAIFASVDAETWRALMSTARAKCTPEELDAVESWLAEPA